jgi:hypothetical protein
MRSATAPEVPKRSADGIANRDSLTGDRGFESISLQRRVLANPAKATRPNIHHRSGGTEGSNPPPSSGESAANLTSSIRRQSRSVVSLAGDRGFESFSLQQRVKHTPIIPTNAADLKRSPSEATTSVRRQRPLCPGHCAIRTRCSANCRHSEGRSQPWPEGSANVCHLNSMRKPRLNIVIVVD